MFLGEVVEDGSTVCDGLFNEVIEEASPWFVSESCGQAKEPDDHHGVVVQVLLDDCEQLVRISGRLLLGVSGGSGDESTQGSSQFGF